MELRHLMHAHDAHSTADVRSVGTLQYRYSMILLGPKFKVVSVNLATRNKSKMVMGLKCTYAYIAAKTMS